MPQEQFYDKAFAELFHHPKFIRSLLLDFIDEEWVCLIDLDSMKIEEGEHKSMGDRPLRSDLVISFDFLAGPGGAPEHGSEVPPSPKGFSIYLLLEYLSRLYRRQKSNRLYPVIPIVIYNGIVPWREKPVFEEQFVFIPDSLRPNLPLYRYILIDEGRYDEALLRRLKGEVAAFFRIDTVDLGNREAAADRIIEVLQEMRGQDEEIHSLLSRYVEEYIKRRRKPMLAQRWEALLEKNKEEGLEIVTHLMQ